MFCFKSKRFQENNDKAFEEFENRFENQYYDILNERIEFYQNQCQEIFEDQFSKVQDKFNKLRRRFVEIELSIHVTYYN